MNYKEIAKDTERMIWRVSDRGHKEALGAVKNGRRHHQESEMSQQHQDLAQKVNA